MVRASPGVSPGVKLSAFQSRVYNALRCVPRGRVTTYRELAMAVGCGSCQAVGQALMRNPFAPEVPCHRVIASNLAPGGFCGHVNGSEVARKLRLLRAEGVRFENGLLADPARLFRFNRH